MRGKAGGSGEARHDCNCRCFIEYNLMTAEEFEKATGKSLTKDNKSDTINESSKGTEAPKSIIRQRCEDEGIEYIEVLPHKTKLTENEIIEHISGGDETGGSCSSLAFAYIGNKGGYNVLDYRGGVSRKFFSNPRNLLYLTELDGVEAITEIGDKNLYSAHKLLDNVESNKEYYFATGTHATIVRNNQLNLEYLELQAPTSDDNGFQLLNEDKLLQRFGYNELKKISKVRVLNILIDIETLYKNKEFIKILGYINTAKTKQVKGELGNMR